MSEWKVYIVECSDKSLYTGITTNLEARIRSHNLGLGAKYTRSRRPVRLVYSEDSENRSTASKREYEIKQLSRQDKLELVKSYV